MLVVGVLGACGETDVEQNTVTMTAAPEGSPTVAPFLIPSTPTPVPTVPPVDTTLLNILGAGPVKRFPPELMPGSPELPYDEVKRLWTEYQTNIYLIEGSKYVIYLCQGGYGATPINQYSPRNETYGLTWAIVDQSEIPRMEWYEARMTIRGQAGDSHVVNLSPPLEGDRFGDGKDHGDSGPASTYIYEKTDCSPSGDPKAEPTALPALPVSNPLEERTLKPELLARWTASDERTGDEQVALWTEYLSDAHLIPTGVTAGVKLESEFSNAKIGAYLISAHKLGGSYDLLLCGDGRYHWMGSAPVNIVNYAESGWRGGQDGDWEVDSRNGAPRLQLIPDDPRVIKKAVSFPLAIEDGQLASTIVVQGRIPNDLIVTVFEASGCP